MLYDAILSRTPVTGGWTTDRKFCAKTADGTKYFLRIAAPERADRLEKVFRFQEQAAVLGIPVARPVEYGIRPEGFYTLETWIEGRDARDVIPDRSASELYADGLAAGRILRKLHTIPAPAELPDWASRYNARLDRKIAEYEACPLKYEVDEPILRRIAEDRGLLDGRPQTFQHGDFHVGNFMYAGNRLHVIDFDRCSFGDPWEEFKKLPWCVEESPALASGMLDGYFDGKIPEKFWRLLALYLCCVVLSNLPWAIPFGRKEIDVMYAQAKQILAWYEDGVIPPWYTAFRP